MQAAAAVQLEREHHARLRARGRRRRARRRGRRRTRRLRDRGAGRRACRAGTATITSSQPSGGGCSTDGVADHVGARERRFPTVAQRAGAERDVLALAEQPFGRQPRGRAAVDRRGDRFERRSRDTERREALGAHAAQHARAHAVAEERGHRREPVARDPRRLVHGRDLLGRVDAPQLGEDRARRRRARRCGSELAEERVHRRVTCRRRRRCARSVSPGIARSAPRSFAGIPRDRVEVLAREVLEAVVAVGQQVHRAGVAHDDAARRERRACPPATAGRRPTPRGRWPRGRAPARRCRRAPSRSRQWSSSAPAAMRRSRPDSVELGPAREPEVSVFGDRDDLLAAVAAVAVFPHDRLEHEHHARLRARSTRRTRRRGRCR